MVLYKYVINPFEDNASFDWELFQKDVISGIIFLNIVSSINQNRHPLKEQVNMDIYSRRVGLELTGIADALAMLNLQYGSKESIQFLKEMMMIKAFMELYASSKAVAVSGRAPALNSEEAITAFLQTEYIDRIVKNISVFSDKLIVNPVTVILEINDNGLANTAFNTLGPCGSISIVSDNCTSGIEPLYADRYTRRTRLGGTYELLHGPALLYCIENNKDYNSLINTKYKQAHTISWEDRIAVQSALQQYTDSSVSSTVNLPNSATVAEIESIYTKAWEYNLKGITIFRDGCKQGVLSIDKPEEQKSLIGLEKTLLDTENAERHKIKWKNGVLYCIVSLDDDEVPVEIFVKLPRTAGLNKDGIFEQERYNDYTAVWDGLCRLISKLLRYNVPLEDILEQLDKASYSMVDATGVLARILRRYLQDNVVIPYEDKYFCSECGSEAKLNNKNEIQCTNCNFCATITLGEKCPECGEYSVVSSAGCKHCTLCTYDKCN